MVICGMQGCKDDEAGRPMMFVGEIIEASATKNQPLVYSDGKYWSFGSRIQKSDQKMLERIKNLFEKYKK